MFDVEYWSLEQAKLGKAAEKPLARQVGGRHRRRLRHRRGHRASAMAREGAEVAVLDRDLEGGEARGEGRSAAGARPSRAM